MRVNQYSIALEENGRHILVKDSARNYTTYDRLDNPEKIVGLMRDMFQLHTKAEEYLYLICMNIKGCPVGFFEISHGTCNLTLASPREILMRALLCGAVCITLVHNHPSGDLAPSKQDGLLTEQIQAAANIIGITLCDHIIIGGCTYYSFMQEGRLKPPSTDV